MGDLLYDAAIQYKSLLNKGYDIVLGRKSKTYLVKIRFSQDSFYHLAGLQHLTDITYTSKNKERIYKDILARKITYETISKSVFYEEYFVEERITYLKRLEEMLDSCQFMFLINHKEYIKFTRIYADYLCKYVLPEDKQVILYFFTVKVKSSRIKNEFKGCSFFKKHDIDYTRGASETKLLLNKKLFDIRSDSALGIELFRHPKYVETEETQQNDQ